MKQTPTSVRLNRAAAPVVVLTLALLVLPGSLGAQRPTFGPTLFWESGLINAPAVLRVDTGSAWKYGYARYKRALMIVKV